MKKILAIGNSFSEDATKYLHGLSESAGVETKVVNLYVGGCSLERHWENICGNIPMYQVQVDGVLTERHASIDETLREEDWDFVVTQQASHDSGWLDTYEPFFGLLLEHVRELAPQAELVLHETWAYEIDSQQLGFANYDNDQALMYQKLCEAYRAVADKLNVRIIPVGDMVQSLRKRKPFIYEQGGKSLCRDGFHLDLIYGRYLAAAVWYKTFTSRPLRPNFYVPSTALAPDAVCHENTLKIIKETIDEML